MQDGTIELIEPVRRGDDFHARTNTHVFTDPDSAAAMKEAHLTDPRSTADHHSRVVIAFQHGSVAHVHSVPNINGRRMPNADTILYHRADAESCELASGEVAVTVTRPRHHDSSHGSG